MPEAKKTSSRKSTRTRLNFVGTPVFNQYRNGLENRGFTKWFKLVNNGVKKAYKNRTHRFLMKQNKRKVLKYYTLGLFFLPNTTPKSSGITQLALAYPLDFSGKKKVQRFSFVFADSQYFA